MPRPQLGTVGTSPTTLTVGDVAAIGSAGVSAALADHRHAVPAGFTPEQVSQPNGISGLDQHVVQAKIAGDAQYRFWSGLDSSDRARIRFGAGGTNAQDVSLYRDSSRSVTLEGVGGSGPLFVVARPVGVASLTQHVGVKVVGDANYRLALALDNLDNPQLYMRRGTAGTVRLTSDQDERMVVTGDSASARFGVAANSAAAVFSLFAMVTGDNQPRASLGLDASGYGRLMLGPGGTTAQDIVVSRDSAGSVRFSSGGAAASSSITVESTAGQSSYVGLMVAGDTGLRTILRGDATGSAIWFGPGNAGQDVVLSRTAANELSLASGDSFNIVGGGASYKYASTQVVGSRKTGWAAATGTATRTTFVTSSVTLPLLAERVKALIDDLIAHGLIGA